MRQKAAIFKSEGACRHSPDSRFRGKADIQMSSIAAIMNMGLMPVERLEKKLGVMNRLQAHRGNDGEGYGLRPTNALASRNAVWPSLTYRAASSLCPTTRETGSALTDF